MTGSVAAGRANNPVVIDLPSRAYGHPFSSGNDALLAQRIMTSGKAPARTPIIGTLAVWAAAFALSLGQWRHTAYFFGNCDASQNCDMRDVMRNVEAEIGVLQGYPHWRHFQSRLLGPWAEYAVNLVFSVNFAVAHMVVAIIVLTLCGVTMFYAGRAIGSRQSGWTALFAFETLFALLMSRPWLYIWDYFVLLVGATFLLLVIRRAPWWAFLLLMGAAFFNHESALFIGVWMVIAALSGAWSDRRRPDWLMLGGGVLGSLAGLALTEALRTALLKKEMGWLMFNDAGRSPSSWFDTYFHLQITANLEDITQWVTHPDFALMFLVPVPVILALALAAILLARHGYKALPLAAYGLAQAAALFMFGMRSETRDLLQLVPFLCLGGMLAAKSDWNMPLTDRHAAWKKVTATEKAKSE
jgi:hypothetical protein